MSQCVRIVVTLKNAVLDPQGEAVLKSLKTLGFDDIEDVRIGKVIELNIKDGDMDEPGLREKVSQMAENLLCNSVMENFHVEILNHPQVLL